MRAAAVLLAALALGASVGFTSSAFQAPAKNSGNTFQASSSFGCAESIQTVVAAADTYVNSGSTNSNFATSTSLYVRSYKQGNLRVLLSFNLPSLPAGCVVSSAFLRVRSFSATQGRTIEAYRIGSSWNAGTVTWNNQPPTTGTPVTPGPLYTGYQDWDVTSHVEAMYGGAPNHGWLIKDSAEGLSQQATQSYWARNYNGSSGTDGTAYAPELVIRFAAAPCSARGESGSVLSAADSYVLQTVPTMNLGSATKISAVTSAGNNGRALVRFDLPPIPAGCELVAGQLRLDATFANGRVEAWRATDAWTEMGVTWENQPATAGPADSDHAAGSVDVFDVRSLLDDMYQGANNGFLLRYTSENAGTTEETPYPSRESTGFVPRVNLLFG